MSFRASVRGLLSTLLFLTAACGNSILDAYPFPEGMVFFTHPPLDLDGASFFNPMGSVNVLPRDHGGFALAEPYVFPASVPVLAVADGVVFEVSNGRRTVPPIPDAPEALWGREYEDHLITLKVSESIQVNYAHVTTFHPDFAALLGDLPVREEAMEVGVEVQAGDTLGFVGPHAAMDFSVTDLSLRLSLLNPSRYPNNHPFSADIMAYYREPLLSRIVGITPRTAPPWGGKIDYDIEGRIIGNWFLEGTTSFIQWSRQLAIVYDHIHAERITISDGSPMRDVPGIENPGGPDVWWVRGNTPLPETVGVESGITKYTLIFGQDIRETEFNENLRPVQGVMLVEMIDPGRIRVEVFKGTTEPEAFTSAAKVYVR